MDYGKFGNSGETLSRIGLGCYGMSGAYGAADDTESIATIHRAIERGVNLLDTSARYGGGHNHKIIGQAIRDRRDKVFIHSKTGTIHTADGRSVAEGSGTPERLREICEQSLKNLSVDHLDALCMSRIDPTVPIEESVGAMAQMVEEGKTRFISLSEAGVETLRRGAAAQKLIALQFEYSLWSRDPEDGHIDACRDLGLAFMAYAPFGYGFLTGDITKPGAQSDSDTRQKFPRFQEENFEANRKRVSALEDFAKDKGATPAQICLAWLLAQGEQIFAIPGCKSRRHLDENLDAVEIKLTPSDLAQLDTIFPKGTAAGTRYPAEGMKRVNL
ncbi:MAG: aldo/keto reductase [Rhodospirillaceae bacterium]|nr:aldo/keto reductase [Rhodospirillaceae bacterium]MBT5047241.1 aldo/keto reductase [Rhodospirillaceae bacterium]MBT5458407.1 aldo/keto reductase [Rhodospirillaceae bacterium]